jgi:hypothetical protein
MEAFSVRLKTQAKVEYIRARLFFRGIERFRHGFVYLKFK